MDALLLTGVVQTAQQATTQPEPCSYCLRLTATGVLRLGRSAASALRVYEIPAASCDRSQFRRASEALDLSLPTVTAALWAAG